MLLNFLIVMLNETKLVCGELNDYFDRFTV